MTSETSTSAGSGEPDDTMWNGGDALVGRAKDIPIGPATPFMLISPVAIPSPGRAVELTVRVTAPTTGSQLPVILLSHGGGFTNYLSSFRGFSPLADFWAAHGLVVVQPTHLSSRSLGVPRVVPESRAYWQSRVDDLTAILDHLDLIESAVPGLAGRIARDRIGVAGHSMGGQTASMLLGAHVTDEAGTVIRVADERVKAGVLLAPTGAGGEHLTEMASRFTCLRTAGFDQMATPTLTIVGERDKAAELTTRGPAYHADPYVMSPGPKSLLTLVDGEHMLGGITGYDTVETTDEHPERVAAIQRLSWAYFHGVLVPNSVAWERACGAFATLTHIGSLESK
jgi:pimeloyl-ACP methyl ester carboxylesterase